jgi:TatD DNase family protein
MSGAPKSHEHNDQPSLRFVDTHCHLDDEVFVNSIDDVLATAIAGGVTSFVNIGYEPKRWASSIDLARRFPSVSYALGMHPQHADDWNQAAADEIAGLLETYRPRAIGEIGIDLFRGETNLAQQQLAFDEQLDLAVAHNLPVVIHMRSAQSEVLNVLNGRSTLPPLLFHSFEGDEELTRFVLKHDSIVGVGGLATRPKSVTIRQQLEKLPLTNLVLETDSPYLIPTKARGSHNTPRNIPVIARFVAEVKHSTLEHIATQTTENAERFFGKLGNS